MIIEAGLIIKGIAFVITLLLGVIAFFFKRLVNNIDRLTIAISDLQVELSDFKASHEQKINSQEQRILKSENAINDLWKISNSNKTEIATIKEHCKLKHK